MYDCIIIGGGVAGLSASIYLRRKSLNVLMLTLDIGGRTNLPKYIENYPGFSKIEGYKIPLSMKEQAESLGLEIRYEKVHEVRKDGGNFFVDGYGTKTVLLQKIILEKKNFLVFPSHSPTGNVIWYPKRKSAPFLYI